MGWSFKVAELADVPLFNMDVEAVGFPEPVADLRDEIATADAVLFACPEYNNSFSGVLKNTIDWLSRGPKPPLLGKPGAILGAGGRFGTIRAQHHLRQTLFHERMNLVMFPEVAVTSAFEQFDDDLNLINDRYRDQVARLVEALIVLAEP